MKKQIFLNDYLEIATLHAGRLSAALNQVEKMLPFSAEKFEQLQTQEIAFLDMLTTRFSKLQDEKKRVIFIKR